MIIRKHNFQAISGVTSEEANQEITELKEDIELPTPAHLNPLAPGTGRRRNLGT